MMYGQMSKMMKGPSLAGAMNPMQTMQRMQTQQGMGMGGAAPTPAGGGMGNPMQQMLQQRMMQGPMAQGAGMNPQMMQMLQQMMMQRMRGGM